jgi:hypothetical protein
VLFENFSWVGKSEDQLLIASLGLVKPGEKRMVVRGTFMHNAGEAPVKCLLDSAADLNLVSHVLVKQMGLSRPPSDTAVMLQ